MFLKLTRRFSWILASRHSVFAQILVREVLAAKPRSEEMHSFPRDARLYQPSENERLNVEVVVVSNRPVFAKRAAKGIRNYRVRHLDGSNAESFSHLVNVAISSSNATTVIILGDKCFPHDSDIDRALGMIRMGYPVVSLFRFGCFAITKDAFAYLGNFDETFKGGGFEDSDYVLRIFSNDLAYWESESVPYFPLRSSWNPDTAQDRFREKWNIQSDRLPQRRHGVVEGDNSRRSESWKKWSDGRLGVGSLGSGLPFPNSSSEKGETRG